MAKDPSIKGEIKRFSIEFYSEKVLAELLEFPVSIRARCFLLLDRMKEDGPNLGFPYTRKIVGTEAILKLEEKQKKESAEYFIARLSAAKSSSFMPLSRKPKRHRKKILILRFPDLRS